MDDIPHEFPLVDVLGKKVSTATAKHYAVYSKGHTIINYCFYLREKTKCEHLGGICCPATELSQSCIKQLLMYYGLILKCHLGVCHALANAIIPSVMKVLEYFEIGISIPVMALRSLGRVEVMEDYHFHRMEAIVLLRRLVREFGTHLQLTYQLSDSMLLLAHALPEKDRWHLQVPMPASVPVEWLMKGSYGWLAPDLHRHGNYPVRTPWVPQAAPNCYSMEWNWMDDPMAWERPASDYWYYYQLAPRSQYTQQVLDQLQAYVECRYTTGWSEEVMLQEAREALRPIQVAAKLKNWQLSPTEELEAQQQFARLRRRKLWRARYGGFEGFKVFVHSSDLPVLMAEMDRAAAAAAAVQPATSTEPDQPAAAAAVQPATSTEPAAAVARAAEEVVTFATTSSQPGAEMLVEPGEQRYGSEGQYNYAAHFRAAMPVTGKPGVDFVGDSPVDSALAALQQGALGSVMVLLQSVISRGDDICWEEAGRSMLYQLRSINHLILATTLFEHGFLPSGAPQGMVCSKHHLCGHPGMACEPLTPYTYRGTLGLEEVSSRADRARTLRECNRLFPDVEWLLRPGSDFSPAWLTVMGAVASLYPGDMHSILLLVLAALDVAMDEVANNGGDGAEQLGSVLRQHKEEWQQLAAVWASEPTREDKAEAAAVGVHELGDTGGDLFVATVAKWRNKNRTPPGLQQYSLTAGQLADYYRHQTRPLGNRLTVDEDTATPNKQLQRPLYPRHGRQRAVGPSTPVQEVNSKKHKCQE